MKTLLAYGDSNTYGTPPMRDLYGDTPRLGLRERWPGILAALLGPDWQVIAEGLPGRTTVHDDPLEGAWKNGRAVLPAVMESHLPLTHAILMLGTNDLKARFSLTAADIVHGMALLVADMRRIAPGLDILLIAPPPIREVGCLAPMFAGGAEKSRAFGTLARDLASREGLRFLDAGAVIASSPVDGIHYDAAEHDSLARAVRGVLMA